MIVYRKAFLGLHLLFRLYGSAIVRTALWGALAATQTALLYALVPDHVSQFFTEGRVMSYTLFTALLSLLVVFRQNAGYGRFHEGRVRLQTMTAAWTDACIKVLSFDGGCRSLEPPDEASRRFCSDCVHLFSLLHATALQFLRSDWLLENLSEHDQAKLPPWDSGNSPNYKPSLLDYFVLRSVSTRRLPYNAAHPIPVIGRLSAAEEEMLKVKGERTRTLDSTGWGSARKGSGPLRTFLRYSFGPSQGKYVRGAAERAYQVFSWVHERCRHRMVEDGLDMPAPILATMYSSLQKGLEAFEQCRYLCDTPFPFSWSQLLMAMLLANQFMLPFVIVSSIQDWALGIVFAVVATQAYWALNEVAREMEAQLSGRHCSGRDDKRGLDGSTVIRLLASPARHLTSVLAPPHPAPHPHPPSADPYCFEPNDIPLPRLQYQFNERLLAAANSQLPGSSVSTDSAFQHKVWRAIQRAASGSVGAPDAEMSLDAEVQVVVTKS